MAGILKGADQLLSVDKAGAMLSGFHMKKQGAKRIAGKLGTSQTPPYFHMERLVQLIKHCAEDDSAKIHK